MIIYKLDEVKSIATVNKAYLGNDVVYQSFKETKPIIYGDNVLAFEFTGNTPQHIIIDSKMHSFAKSPVIVDIVKDLNVTNFTNASLMFFQGVNKVNNITKILNIPDTSMVTNFDSIFYGCDKLTEIDLSKLKTSNADNFEGMFQKCSSLVNLNLSFFDTRNITNISNIFRDCSSLTAINLMNWNLDNVTSLINVFRDCTLLKKIYMRGCNQSTIDKIKKALADSLIPEGQVTIVQ